MSTISDQKKRTLEAIQQRYAAVKAKKLQDELLKCQKNNRDSTPKPNFDALRKGKTPEFTPCRTSAQLLSHKAISSSSHQQKPSASSGGEINPVYSELSFALHHSLSQDEISDSDSTNVVHGVLCDIIQKGGDTGRISKVAKKLKLEKRILLDNYVQKGPRLADAQARSLSIHSKRSKRHMSLKQHKKCGSFDVHDTFRKFDLYKPLHDMWNEYIQSLTKGTSKKQLSEYLLSADLHGSLLIVAECKAASYEGVSGIMIRETTETFGIISEDNRFREAGSSIYVAWRHGILLITAGCRPDDLASQPAVVPKAGSVFILQADCWKVTLIGDKLSPKEKLKEDQRQQRAQSLVR